MGDNPEQTVSFLGELLQNVSLARYSTWKVGGVAKQVYQPASLDDLCAFLKTLSAKEPIFFLGLGSNTLVRSGGIAGTVIVLRGGLSSCQKVGEEEILVEAGLSCAKLARFSARNGQRGLEFLVGIPGTVGGALAMNAGCHGSAIWEKVNRVSTVDRLGRVRTYLPDDFSIAYREVGSSREEWFVCASLRVEKGLAEESFQLIETYLHHRETTQPIDLPNGGSVFCNPKGEYAGRLIETCGLKGYILGGAQVSHKHANFIVNLGNATPEDIESLVCYVENIVFMQCGIRLRRELRILGAEART